MATTKVSDALVVPQAKGTGLSNEDDPIDAAIQSLLAGYDGDGEYVGSGMEFTAHDGIQKTVDVTTGHCFIYDDSSATGGSRSSSGNPQVQYSSSSGYDTEIPDNQVYMVLFPSDVTISCSPGRRNQIWVNITDVTSNNAVEVRSDGGVGTTAEPGSTYVKLGEANPDDSGADVRTSDSPTVSSMNNILYADPGEVQPKIDEVSNSSEQIGGVVKLRAQTEYNFTGVRVKPRVTLDFNGARVVPGSDANILEIDDRGKVLNPVIDYSTVPFTSNVFVFDTAWSARYVGSPQTWVRGGYTRGTAGEGTVFYFHDSAGHIISFVECNHNTMSVGKVVDFFADSTDATVNGNIIRGVHKDFQTAMTCRSTPGGNVTGNTMIGWLQPEAAADRGLYIKQGSSNHFIGYIWDEGNFDVATMEVTSDGGDGNIILDWGSTNPANIVDNGAGVNGGISYIDLQMTSGGSTIFGKGASIGNDSEDTVIGKKATSDGERNVIIGAGATGSNAGQSYQTIVGRSASATQNHTTTIGAGANADGHHATALGRSASATVRSAVALGADSSVSGIGALAIGRGVTTATDNVARVGNAGDDNSPQQLAFAAVDRGVLGNADMNSEELTFEPDESNKRVVMKYKDSNGTVRTAEVLTWS